MAPADAHVATRCHSGGVRGATDLLAEVGLPADEIETLIRQLADRGFYVMGVLPRDGDRTGVSTDARSRPTLKH